MSSASSPVFASPTTTMSCSEATISLSPLAADPCDIDPAAERQDALAHTHEAERLGAVSHLGVNAAAIILDGENKLVGVGPDRHVDPGGAGVARNVSQQFLKDPEHRCGAITVQ